MFASPLTSYFPHLMQEIVCSRAFSVGIPTAPDAKKSEKSMIYYLTLWGGVSEAVDYSETIKKLGYINNALNSLDSDKMDFWDSELYYILSKKELDLASELNKEAHGKSVFARLGDYEKVWEDYLNEQAQEELLDAQNAIRKEFFANNGLKYTAKNPYNSKELLNYINTRYSVQVKDEKIKCHNTSLMHRTSVFNPDAFELRKNMKYEIVRAGTYKTATGTTYEGVSLVDEKGDHYMVNVNSMPGLQQLVDKRFNITLNNTKVTYEIDSLHHEIQSSKRVSGQYYIEGKYESKGKVYYILHGKDSSRICVEESDL